MSAILIGNEIIGQFCFDQGSGFECSGFGEIEPSIATFVDNDWEFFFAVTHTLVYVDVSKIR